MPIPASMAVPRTAGDGSPAAGPGAGLWTTNSIRIQFTTARMIQSMKTAAKRRPKASPALMSGATDTPEAGPTASAADGPLAACSQGAVAGAGLLLSGALHHSHESPGFDHSLHWGHCTVPGGPAWAAASGFCWPRSHGESPGGAAPAACCWSAPAGAVAVDALSACSRAPACECSGLI